MKSLTVATPVSERSVEQDGVLFWINKEAAPALRSARAALNFATVSRDTVTTDGAGTYAELWRSEALPTDGCWLVYADVVGVTTTGTAQRAAYFLRAAFESTAGTVAQVGATASDAFESTAAINARFAVDATNRQVYLEARDDGASPMYFVGRVSVMEANAA